MTSKMPMSLNASNSTSCFKMLEAALTLRQKSLSNCLMNSLFSAMNRRAMSVYMIGMVIVMSVYMIGMVIVMTKH